MFGPNNFPNFLIHRGTIFGPNKTLNCLRNWMCRRPNLFHDLEFYLGQILSLYAKESLGQYLTQIFRFIEKSKLSLYEAKYFGQRLPKNTVPNFLLHRGTIFGPSKIPNRKRNWMRWHAPLSGIYTSNFFSYLKFYFSIILCLYEAK